MKIKLYQDDLPKTVIFKDIVAIDTEAMGLNHQRDRLCLIQISSGNGTCYLIKINDAKKKTFKFIETFKK